MIDIEKLERDCLEALPKCPDGYQAKVSLLVTDTLKLIAVARAAAACVSGPDFMTNIDRLTSALDALEDSEK